MSAALQSLIRRLDVALNGHAGAAKAPLLIDILAQVETLARKHGPILDALAAKTSQADSSSDSKPWIGRAAECAKEIIAGPLAVLDPARDPAGDSLGHLRWMAEELAAQRIDSETKACRWLGYIQGYMVARNVSTLEREKARNLRSGKPAKEFTNAEPPAHQTKTMRVDALNAELNSEDLFAELTDFANVIRVYDADGEFRGTYPIDTPAPSILAANKFALDSFQNGKIVGKEQLRQQLREMLGLVSENPIPKR